MSEHDLWFSKYRSTYAPGSSDTHLGKLELITWEFTEEDGSLVGWAGSDQQENQLLKKEFVNEFKEDLEQFFNYFPGAFRWTCW
jgi:hypothetical protein